MKRVAILAALLLSVAAASAADAQRRHRPHGHHDWHDRWENRRDARRAGVVVGALTRGIAGAAGRAEAERRYEQCLYATGYDYECERRLYYDQRRARRAARRSGATAGAIAWGIVRD